jgi:hypothetical protein
MFSIFIACFSFSFSPPFLVLLLDYKNTFMIQFMIQSPVGLLAILLCYFSKVLLKGF